MTIKFNDATNTELEFLQTFETKKNYSGSNRSILTVVCDTDAIGVNALNELLSDEENLEHISLSAVADVTDENGNVTQVESVNVLDDYVLKLEVGIKDVQAETDHPISVGASGTRLIFKLGQRTELETRLANVEKQLAQMGI